MRIAQDDVLNLRLPRDLRADLDGAARDSGSRLSAVARRALRAGLASIRSPASNDDGTHPPPGAPAASMPVAA